MQTISNRTSGQQELSIGQIVAKDHRKAQVFKKYGLDFCCGGKKTVKEACEAKGLDVAIIEQELQQADIPLSRSLPFNDWSLDFLADYIVNTHHTYVKKNLPDIKFYAEKVARVHGGRHPELLSIHKWVEFIYSELTAHMIQEETVLFPHIKALVASANSGIPFQATDPDTLKTNMVLMENEHEAVGKGMKEIRSLSNNYSLPQDACATYRVFYQMLEDFESDLHLHVHLENNILFPKALELENR